MVEIRNDCSGCDLPCIGCSCDYKVFICDKCGAEVEVLYWDENGEQLCAECMLEGFEKVEQ